MKTGWENAPEELRQLAASLMPQTTSTRYCYWENSRGEMFCYSTAPVHGKFVAWTYKPFGKGSRSGDPQKWRPVDRVEFSKRKVAKARAYARYLKSKEGECKS